MQYTVVRSDADRSVTTTLSGGTFARTDDGIDVLDATGAVVSTVPLALTTEGSDLVIDLAPQIEDNGTKLVTHPVAQDIGQWVPTSPKSRSIEAGIAIGTALGFIGALVVGIGISVATMGIGIIAMPFIVLISALVGAGIGGAAGAAIPNSDTIDGMEYQANCYGDRYYHYCS